MPSMPHDLLYAGHLDTPTMVLFVIGGLCLLAMEALVLHGILAFRKANGGRPLSITANSWLGFSLAAILGMYGAFFYVLVGVHGLHLVAGL
ncbi:MAG: hypothetical protein HY319_24395, partial [Armatimonadetes bacterium]|nr:hypothetical protein [Armatimonadota bacterium]